MKKCVTTEGITDDACFKQVTDDMSMRSISSRSTGQISACSAALSRLRSRHQSPLGPANDDDDDDGGGFRASHPPGYMTSISLPTQLGRQPVQSTEEPVRPAEPLTGPGRCNVSSPAIVWPGRTGSVWSD